VVVEQEMVDLDHLVVVVAVLVLYLQTQIIQLDLTQYQSQFKSVLVQLLRQIQEIMELLHISEVH
jgi:hypothetical protein|tara:strand:+ start:160 stop:354 length:195 start_codon:yes stop_codon:yes gene_type:complete